MVYFLMILSYVELARKGMWIFFRMEEDHSTNIGNFTAVLDDSKIYEELELLRTALSSKDPAVLSKDQPFLSVIN
jgi:hypothetical protein